MRKLLLILLSVHLFSNICFAQNRQVTGTVTDAATGEKLPGVTLTIKGTSTSVPTNNDGKYAVTITNNNSTLLVKYIGYTPQEVSVGGKTQLDIKLVQVSNSLNEVVVMGYGNVKRGDLTGSVSSLKSDEIKDVPVNSAEQALTGRLAGVQVTTSEGSPFAEVKIVVRGGNSVNQDNSPLYIIDGVQVENGLQSISPSDIESIDILKDASATAIYGARGSNGIVMVTTKSGKAGKTRISYNGFFGTNRLAKKLDVMSPYDYVIYQYERSRINTAEQTAFDATYGTNFAAFTKFQSVPAVDWQKMVLGNAAYMQTHNVSVSGGGKKVKFNFGYTNNQQQGTVINTSYLRHLFSSKTDFTLDKWRIGVSARYSYTVPRGVGTSDEGNALFNRLRAVVKYKPLNLNDIPPDEFDEDYFNQTNSGNSLGVVNPFVADNSEYRTAKNNVANGSVYADYKFNSHWSVRVSGGYAWNDGKAYGYFDTLSSTARSKGGGKIMASIINRNNQTATQSNVLTYNQVSKKNIWNVIFGQEIYFSRTTGTTTFARDIPFGTTRDEAFDNIDSYNKLVGAAQPTFVQNTQLSFFTRANYTYDRRYLATFTLRADGSSKFAPDKRWGYFPSGSFAWRVSNEKFMKNNKVFSDLKLRLSYGLSGNNRIGDYKYTNSYKPNLLYPLLDDVTLAGYQATGLANPNLRWESTLSKNVGLDMSFFNSRLQITIDAYHNKTNDVLIAAPIPSISGYTSQLQNIASTLNKGLEFQISGNIIRKKNFSWNSSFNMSFNKNTILKISNQQESYLESSGWGVGTAADYIVKVGKSVGSIYGYIVDGFYTVSDFNYNPISQALSLKSTVVKNTIITPQPGSVKFRDITGDNSVGAEDRDIIGDATPLFYGGFNQQFTFHNFDASVFVNFQVGNKVFNANKLEFTNGFAPGTNLLESSVNRWHTIDGDGVLLQYFNTTSGVTTSISPDRLAAANISAQTYLPIVSSQGYLPLSSAVEDGSFLRINNITLGYTFKKSTFLTRAHIGSLRAYITLNNVAIITKYSGFDPEVNTRRSSPVTPGVDYSGYPRARSYYFGINLSL